jgi:hypothetical protein
MLNELDEQRLDKMACELAEATRLWIDSKAMWRAFANAFPGLAQSPDQRRLFMAALREIERRGVIQLPPSNGKRWDRTFDIAVPTSVYFVTVRKDKGEPA